PARSFSYSPALFPADAAAVAVRHSRSLVSAACLSAGHFLGRQTGRRLTRPASGTPGRLDLALSGLLPARWAVTRRALANRLVEVRVAATALSRAAAGCGALYFHAPLATVDPRRPSWSSLGD